MIASGDWAAEFLADLGSMLVAELGGTFNCFAAYVCNAPPTMHVS